MEDQQERGSDLKLRQQDVNQLLTQAEAKFFEINHGKPEGEESWLNLIPAECHTYIDSLVKKNYPHFQEQFDDISSFREAVAKNWFLKNKAFENYMAQAGMTEVEQINADSREGCAILTGSGSILLLTEADPTGLKGIFYSQVNLRQEDSTRFHEVPLRGAITDDAKVRDRINFAWINGAPDIFNRDQLLAVYKQESENWTPPQQRKALDLNTSPAFKIYTTNIFNAQNLLATRASMMTTNTSIDEKTIYSHGKK